MSKPIRLILFPLRWGAPSAMTKLFTNVFYRVLGNQRELVTNITDEAKRQLNSFKPVFFSFNHLSCVSRILSIYDESVTTINYHIYPTHGWSTMTVNYSIFVGRLQLIEIEIWWPATMLNCSTLHSAVQCRASHYLLTMSVRKQHSIKYIQTKQLCCEASSITSPLWRVERRKTG